MKCTHPQLSPASLCLLLLLCCGITAAATATSWPLNGQEPWLVVWNKGVDGDLMWRTLCPTVSTGDEIGDFAAAALEPDALVTTTATGSLQPDTARNLKSVGINGVPQLVLNCSTRFTQLFNGFAGHFTLKELDTIKSHYKRSVGFVISDRPVKVDSPPEPLAATAQDYSSWDGHGAPAAAPDQPPADRADDARPSMAMDFPANGSQPHRQLLFTPPQQLGQAAKRRMLPEEYNATWGLDILDQGQLPLDDVYHYTYNGTGVHVYIMDTGIRTTHNEFIDPVTQRSRAVHGFDAVYGTNSSEDCHGHGSHVAAVVGGNTFGVAKNVTLHAVRVLACDGTAMVSALLKGLEWVARNHIKPAVVHMSIEGGFSSIVNQAVEQLVKVNHVHVVVSSGNSGKDACLASPASAPSALTVAAIDEKVSRWAYANWGACVDVFAPGVAILSAVSQKGDAGVAYKTGTSMAAPFVTGVVAAYLETHPGASPDEVQQKLYQKALRGSVGDDPQGFATMYPSQFPDLLDISSTPNRLLQSNLTGQALLSPGKLLITEATSGPLAINVTLTQQPSAAVTVLVTVPGAWDGTPMASVTPSKLHFTPQDWHQTQVLSLQPRPVCDGDYFVKLSLQGPQVDGFPAFHTVLVSDSRLRSGENAQMARVIASLPFNDTGDSSSFGDNYRCQATDASPDVVYSYAPVVDTDVTISTCGSGFDTKLLVSTNLSDPTTYMCNDDDRSCVTNTACSRLDVSFKAATTVYIVVDGYAGAAGEFSLAITCNPRCPSKSGTIDSSNAPASLSLDTVGGGGSSPSQSTMLMQALLHLARTPSTGATSHSPAALPSPAPTAEAAASRLSQPPTIPSQAPLATTPSRSSLGVGGAGAPPAGTTVMSPGGPSPTSVTKSAPAGQGMQGPLAALLSAAGSNSAGYPPPSPHQAAAAPPSPGDPLGLNRSSSLEGSSSQAANTSDNGATPPRSGGTNGSQVELQSERSEQSRGLAARIPQPSGDAPQDAGTTPASLGRTALVGTARPPADIAGQPGTLAGDLGVVGHADTEQPPDAPLVAGLAHGAGGFSSQPTATQGNRFGGASSLLPEDVGVQHVQLATGAQDTPAQQQGAGSGGSGGRRLEHTQMNDAAVNEPQESEQNVHVHDSGGVRDDVGWESAAADLAALSTQSEQQLPVGWAAGRE